MPRPRGSRRTSSSRTTCPSPIGSKSKPRAPLTLVDGLISDCARMVSERKDKEGWFDLSTLKEPYRVEGKKTMAYELFEQLGSHLPDAIIFPSGGGVGVIAMWKAFDEMEELVWLPKKTK